jgi:hypothetical protein
LIEYCCNSASRSLLNPVQGQRNSGHAYKIARKRSNAQVG